MIITLIADAVRKIKHVKKPVYLKTHKTLTNAECYRVMDKIHNPLFNISKAVAKALLRKGIIKEIPPISTTTSQTLFDASKD